jgi:hypothetical protein
MEMEKVATSIIDYKDGLNVKLINEILERGYLPASSTNRIKPVDYLEQHSRDVISIAEDVPPTRHFFGLIKRQPPRRIIATIWFDQDAWFDGKFRVATAKKWLVETSGRQYLSGTTELIESLAQKFGAKVRIRLSSDAPQFEAQSADHG